MKKSAITAVIVVVAVAIFVAVQSAKKKHKEPMPDFGAPGRLAQVDSIQMLILESFPVQVHAVASGNLPSPCFAIGDINEIRLDKKFTVSIKISEVAEVCAAVLVPFEESIPLSVRGLKAGTYSVEVNGVKDEFTLQTDNFFPGEEPQILPGDAGFVLPSGF